MCFMQHVGDQSLLIEGSQRRKNPGGVAPGCQQGWIEGRKLLWFLVCLLAQPALNLRAVFIAGFSGWFVLDVSTGTGAFARPGFYFYERRRFFFEFVVKMSRQSNYSSDEELNG